MNRYRRPYTRGKSRRSMRSHGRRKGILGGILMVLAAVLVVTAGYLITGGIVSLLQKKPASGHETSSGEIKKDEDKTETVEKNTQELRGVYLPFDKISSAEAQSSFLAFAKETQINAVVIDLKGEDGKLTYQSAIPEAVAAFAISEATVDMPALCNKLKGSGIYVIGRISCFKDNFMPRTEQGRMMSVKNSDGSRRWDTFSWMNPYSNETKSYLLSIVKEASAYGFDEIMLDEVKFPDSVYLAPQLSYADTANGISKPDALISFVNECAEVVHEKRLKLSLTLPAAGAYSDLVNTESGQSFPPDTLKVDFLCPYFQPSLLKQGAAAGSITAETLAAAETNPAAAIKAVTSETTARIKAKNSKIVLRPWIQDYSTATQKYTDTEVKAQIAALYEGGAKGYLSYGTAGSYTVTAYK